MQPKDIFAHLKTLNSVQQAKNWMESIGYDFNPDYTGLNDENEHSNYQNHFHLDIFASELNNACRDAKEVIVYNNFDEEVLADNEKLECYGQQMYHSNLPSHTLLNN